jgi:hypothetical protein
MWDSQVPRMRRVLKDVMTADDSPLAGATHQVKLHAG